MEGGAGSGVKGWEATSGGAWCSGQERAEVHPGRIQFGTRSKRDEGGEGASRRKPIPPRREHLPSTRIALGLAAAGRRATWLKQRREPSRPGAGQVGRRCLDQVKGPLCSPPAAHSSPAGGTGQRSARRGNGVRKGGVSAEEGSEARDQAGRVRTAKAPLPHTLAVAAGVYSLHGRWTKWHVAARGE